MATLAKLLTALTGLAILLAAVTNFTGPILATAEGWSRAGVNLALLAVALVVCFRDGQPAGRP